MTAESEIQKPEDICAANPLFSWIHGTGPLSVLILPCLLIVFFEILVITCARDGTLFLYRVDFPMEEGTANAPGRVIGLAQDLVLLPIVAAIAMMVYSTRILFLRILQNHQFLHSLCAERSTEDATANSLADSLDRSLRFISLRSRSGKLAFIALQALILADCIFNALWIIISVQYHHHIWGCWPDEHLLSFLAQEAFAFFWNGLILGNGLWYVIVTSVQLFWLTRRFAQEGMFRVIPIAPDRQGGLATIGKLAFCLTVVASSGVPVMIGMAIQQPGNPVTIVSSVLYTIFLTVVFFLPLLAVHGVMKRSKEEELTRLATMFRAEYQALSSDPDYDSPERRSDGDHVANALLMRLAQIDRLYQRAESMPVWPFNVTIVVRFLALSALPAVIALFQDALVRSGGHILKSLGLVP
jgi:hypothetical protein